MEFLKKQLSAIEQEIARYTGAIAEDSAKLADLEKGKAALQAVLADFQSAPAS